MAKDVFVRRSDIAALIREAMGIIEEHLTVYGDPDVARTDGVVRQEAVGLRGVAAVFGRPLLATSPFCSAGSGCPIHPDGKGGPWVDLSVKLQPGRQKARPPR